MSDYYSIPTTLGAAKLAAAANNNQALTLSHMAFGDANGVPYLPITRVNTTQLVNERYRIAVQFVVQDTANPNVYIIKARIPANIGGFDVSELAIFDTTGDMIYLANYPRTFKPQITQGAGGELTIKLHVMTSHSNNISIILDPHVITLTQGEGDKRYALKTELDSEAITRENGDLALAVALAAEISNREAKTNNASETNIGISRVATLLELFEGQLDNVFVTPKKLKDALDFVETSTQISLKLTNGLTIKMGRYHIGDLIQQTTGIDPEYIDEFDTDFERILFAFVSPYSLGGAGKNRFFIQKRGLTNHGLTVVATEIESVVQDCGFDWLAIGF